MEIRQLVATERPDIRHSRMGVEKSEFPTIGHVENDLLQVSKSKGVNGRGLSFPRNPQDSSSQQGINRFEIADCCKELRGVGNVEKSTDIAINELETEDLALQNLCAKPVDGLSISVKSPVGCQRQAFSGIEAARYTARAFASLGIKVIVEKCSYCKMIHLKEMR